MGNQSKLGRHVLSLMNEFLDNGKNIDSKGKPVDLLFIVNGAWLKDAAVIDVITNHRGAWDICLVFAHYKNPLQFIVRRITTCFSRQKAISTAFYLRKDAAKDRRGTLSLSIDDLDLCMN